MPKVGVNCFFQGFYWVGFPGNHPKKKKNLFFGGKGGIFAGT